MAPWDFDFSAQSVCPSILILLLRHATSRRNAPLACSSCRRRKVKCDSVQPTCGPCSEHGRSCDYSQSVDGRRRSVVSV